MNTFITKFVSQKCLGYDPKTDRSQWHMVAEFSDGKVREAYLWLGPNTDCTGQEAGWVVVQAISAPAASCQFTKSGESTTDDYYSNNS
jgi:hypothetical protein